jgi:transcriptional regulator with XRE-family HTH domain
MTKPEYLADFMKRHDVDEKQLADILGCTPGAVGHWLKGVRSVPEMLYRLMLFFDDYSLDIRSFHEV